MPSVPSSPVRVIDRGNYALTNYRALCRRGVLWIGQTCNLRCHFCYFLDKIETNSHPEHPFMELEKAKTGIIGGSVKVPLTPNQAAVAALAK